MNTVPAKEFARAKGKKRAAKSAVSDPKQTISRQS